MLTRLGLVYMLEPGDQSLVSGQSLRSQLATMLQLRTFGGLSLRRGAENLTGALTQRRRLAILALLAVAGEGGLSRDKLLAYLWPESDAERARHVLNQLLYAQRRQVGSDSLFIGQKTLRLNPDVIRSDASTFDAALEAGHDDAAVAVYAGPFLDGFFLKDAPEFEQWVDHQRARYARLCLAAVCRLAERARAARESTVAIDWWQRATELDPFDSRAALGLVETLVGAGDRGAALRAARRHEAVLRAELGVAPDPKLLQLMKALSAETGLA